MTVLADVGEARDAPGLFRVVGQHGSTYTVDARTGACTCPDATHRLDADELCKHAHRVAFATGERGVPAWVDRDAVDPDLGRRVDGPRVAAADGGQAATADVDDRADGDDSDGDRPADCDCAPALADEGLPCWPCYREGFNDPNPAAFEDDWAAPRRSLSESPPGPVCHPFEPYIYHGLGQVDSLGDIVCVPPTYFPPGEHSRVVVFVVDFSEIGWISLSIHTRGLAGGITG